MRPKIKPRGTVTSGSPILKATVVQVYLWLKKDSNSYDIRISNAVISDMGISKMFIFA